MAFGGNTSYPAALAKANFQFSVDRTMDGDTVIITIMSSDITDATVVSRPPSVYSFPSRVYVLHVHTNSHLV